MPSHPITPRDIVLIAHDIRSCHNVGSLLRTADGLGVTKVYLTGYTPYPITSDDTRMPHEAAKLDRQIHKTALGAESSQPWEQVVDIGPLLARLANDGYAQATLEQSPDSVKLPDFDPPDKVVLVLGSEVTGVSPELLRKIPLHLEIPMFGRKESFNVVQAAAMALYHLRFA